MAQIKTHFDGKVIMILMIVFILSCGLLAFEMNSKSACFLKEFEIKAPSFKEGEIITFSDNTPGAYEWRWYFGDGTAISYRSKIGHVFNKAGKYKVKLMVNNNCTVEKEITIIPKKEVLNMALMPKFYAPKTVYQGDEVTFADSTSHAKSWEWRFGDSNKIDAIDQNPSHVYRIPGEKVVSLVVNSDIKYIAYQKITVLPAKKEKKDWVKERISRRSESRPDPVEEYFEQIPDAPSRGPEIRDINEAKLKSMLLGVSENRLSYDNLIRYFCTDNLPLVQLAKGKSISLSALDDEIRSRSIKIKNLSLQKDKDGCVTIIMLDFKFKTLF